MTRDADGIIEAYRKAGQGQVFAFFDRLAGAGARAPACGGGRDRPCGARPARRARSSPGARRGRSTSAASPRRPTSGFRPAAATPPAWAAARAAGEAALRAGRVAAFTVAGGQGTRLGYDGPKGTFPVTPVRGRSLFQVFAEKILAAGRRHGRPLHWFIMTSHQNHAATEAFFAEHRHFGLDRVAGAFLPAGPDARGRLLGAGSSWSRTGAIALSPDGHGGSLRALERSGALDLMAGGGRRHAQLFPGRQPARPLRRPRVHRLAPDHGARRCRARWCRKAYPEEKLGHFCVQRGQLVVIEYSDLPDGLPEGDGPGDRPPALRGGQHRDPRPRPRIRARGWRGGAGGAAVPPGRQEDRDGRRRGPAA